MRRSRRSRKTKYEIGTRKFQPQSCLGRLPYLEPGRVEATLPRTQPCGLGIQHLSFDRRHHTISSEMTMEACEQRAPSNGTLSFFIRFAYFFGATFRRMLYDAPSKVPLEFSLRNMVHVNSNVHVHSFGRSCEVDLPTIYFFVRVGELSSYIIRTRCFASTREDDSSLCRNSNIHVRSVGVAKY